MYIANLYSPRPTKLIRTKVRENENGILVNSRNKRITDIRGKTFNRLTAISWFGTSEDAQRAYWVFKCMCGTVKVLNSLLVKRGTTKSCGCLKKEQIKESAFKLLMRMYTQHADKRQLEFTLAFEDFKNIILQKCYYCGTPPSTRRTNKAKLTKKFVVFYSGIDRVDSDKGYVKGNVVPCCIVCNRGKGDLPEKQWLKHLDNLIEFRMKSHA